MTCDRLLDREMGLFPDVIVKTVRITQGQKEVRRCDAWSMHEVLCHASQHMCPHGTSYC